MIKTLSHIFSKTKIVLLCSLMTFTISAFATTKIQPQNLTNKTVCAACYMVVLQYPGTHAQVIWRKNGKLVRQFYGNLSEVMPDILKREESVVATYIQPLGHRTFDKMHERGDWINAENAFYVVRSKQEFIMGESYTPFRSESRAKAFQKRHGGKVLNYEGLKRYVFNQKETLFSLGTRTTIMHNMNMWMFNVMPMYMRMSGLQSGTHSVSAPKGDMMVPKSMDMYMTMVMAMYMTKTWSFMAMSSYNSLYMPMDMNMMGKTKSFTMTARGFGDTQLIGGYNLINNHEQRLTIHGGVNIPSGRINYRGTMPMMSNTLFGYYMQMGSGTFDPILGVDYAHYLPKSVIDFYFKFTPRLYKNYRDYRLGNLYQVGLLANYALCRNITIGPKLEANFTNKISGVAAGTRAGWGVSYNPNDTGGTIVNLFLEGRIYGSGYWHYNSIGFEIGAPIYQYLNGIQMRHRWQASVSLNFMFM